MAFYSGVAAGGNNYIHVSAMSEIFGGSAFYARSTNGGLDWEEGYLLYEEGGPSAVDIQVLADSNYAYVIFTNGGNNYVMRSTDYGENWSDWNDIIIGYGGIFEAVNMDSIMYIVRYALDYHITRCSYSTDRGLTWWPHSDVWTMYGGGVGLGATNTALHWAEDNQEVHYIRYVFDEQVWRDSTELSDLDGESSFRPKVVGWGDSCVMVVWTDYKYSPYSWTGDLIIRRSLDNGLTWLGEEPITDSHLVLGKKMIAVGDTIYVVYDEIVFDGYTNSEEIFLIYSLNGGEDWSIPERLTYADNRSVYPSVSVKGDRIHVAFCDARDDLPHYMNNELYYKGGTITQTGISWAEQLPDNFKLGCYPNPFNGTATIILSGVEGGDARIGIYDIQGRLIKELMARISQGGDKKAVWDARDNSGRRVSSGIYFVRVETPQTVKVKKLLYLR